MRRPDNLQTKIMKELTSSDRFHSDPVMGSYSKIAKRLGVNEDTGRVRLNKARESGFLEGWRLLLNPHLIGRRSATIVLDCDDVRRKRDIIMQLQLIEGVVLVLDFYERGLRVLLYYYSKQDLARKVELITSICGAANALSWENIDPRCDLRLKNTDWEILKALRRSPKSSMSELAVKLRISARTVKRRLLLMKEGNAYFILPKTNIKRFPGFGCHFLLFCPDREKKASIDSLLLSKLERIVYVDTSSKEYSTFSVACDSPSEAEEIHQWIKQLDGVAEVRMDMVREIVHVYNWLDEVIEGHLTQIPHVDSDAPEIAPKTFS